MSEAGQLACHPMSASARFHDDHTGVERGEKFHKLLAVRFGGAAEFLPWLTLTLA